MRREVQIARFWLNSCRVSQSLGSCAAIRSEALVTRMGVTIAAFMHLSKSHGQCQVTIDGCFGLIRFHHREITVFANTFKPNSIPQMWKIWLATAKQSSYRNLWGKVDRENASRHHVDIYVEKKAINSAV